MFVIIFNSISLYYLIKSIKCEENEDYAKAYDYRSTSQVFMAISMVILSFENFMS